MKNAFFLFVTVVLHGSFVLGSSRLQAADVTFTNNPSDHQGTCRAENSFGVSFGDLNNDGYLDILEISHGPVTNNKACIWLNDGLGNFVLEPVASSDIKNPQNVHCHWTAQILDINGDRLPEIYCRSIFAQDFFRNLTANGVTRFGLMQISSGGNSYDQMVFSDVNGDGNIERLSAKDGTFFDLVTGKSVMPGVVVPNSDFFDLDNDTWPDLVNVTAQVVYRNTAGTGYTQMATDPDLAACKPLSTYSYDHDHDGYTDLVCVRDSNTEADVVILRNNHDFTFTRIDTNITDFFGVPQADDLQKGAVAIGDFNNDGLFDVLGSVEMKFYAQTSPGVFSRRPGNALWPIRPSAYSLGGGASKGGYDFADVNNDGLLDVLIGPRVTGSQSTAFVLLNSTNTANRHVGILLRGDAMGTGNNTMGIGTRIVVKAAGTQQILASHYVGNSWKRRGPNLVYHLPVGTAQFVDLEVHWPSGFPASQTFANVRTGTDYEVQFAPGDDVLRERVPGQPGPPVEPGEPNPGNPQEPGSPGTPEEPGTPGTPEEPDPVVDLSPSEKRVFELAESLYPGVFAGPSGVRSSAGFVFKFYSHSGTYLGIRDDMVYIMGGAFGNAEKLLGSVSTALNSLVSPAEQKIFDLAEFVYPELFEGASEVATTSGYLYKFYSGTGTYVGIRNNMVFLMGGAFGNAATNYGSVDDTIDFLIDMDIKLSKELDPAFDSAFQQKAAGLQLHGRGTVTTLLPDIAGDASQRLVVQLQSGQNILLIHNTSLAARLPGIKPGEAVDFSGEYEWSSSGGAMRRTNRDPLRRHVAGWIKYKGIVYQ